jgi:hypothetical protein
MFAVHIVGGKGQPQVVQGAQFAFHLLQAADAFGDFIRFVIESFEQNATGRFAAVAQIKDLPNLFQREIEPPRARRQPQTLHVTLTILAVINSG